MSPLRLKRAAQPLPSQPAVYEKYRSRAFPRRSQGSHQCERARQCVDAYAPAGSPHAAHAPLPGDASRSILMVCIPGASEGLRRGLPGGIGLRAYLGRAVCAALCHGSCLVGSLRKPRSPVPLGVCERGNLRSSVVVWQRRRRATILDTVADVRCCTDGGGVLEQRVYGGLLGGCACGALCSAIWRRALG